jgi:hypothetical protein
MHDRDLTGGKYKPIFEDGLWWILPARQMERLPICTVDHADDHHEGTRQKAEHDANLIAAAPELLEALKACHLQMLQSNNNSEYAEEANQLAIAAIAKAEGRQ